MNGNVLATFFALLAALAIGYEIGRVTMARKVKDLFREFSEMLKKQSEKIRQEQEKQRIERAAKCDEITDQLVETLNRAAERARAAKKEGAPIESNRDS